MGFDDTLDAYTGADVNWAWCARPSCAAYCKLENMFVADDELLVCPSCAHGHARPYPAFVAFTPSPTALADLRRRLTA